MTGTDRASDRQTTTTAPMRLVGTLLLLLVPLGAMGTASQDEELQRIERTRGQAWFEEKRYADAEEAFARVVEAGEGTAADWLNLALAHYEQSEDDAVLAALDRAVALDDTLAGAHYLRGLVAKRNHRAEDALVSFERAAALDRSDPAILYNLAWALEAVGRSEEAKAQYDRIIAMGFDIGLQHYASSLYRRGFLDVREGNRETGQEALLQSRDAQQRLSQAQRAPAALEAGRHKRIVVTPTNVASPVATTADAVRFEAVDLERAGAGAVDLAGEAAFIAFNGEARGVLSSDGRWRDAPLPGGPAALGDADRDGIPDLAVASPDGLHLLRGVAGPDGLEFAAWEVEGLPSTGAVRAIGWVDVDHDGDLDLVIAQQEAPGLRLIDNLGSGSFAETTEAAGLATMAGVDGFTWADFDGDNDTDLYAWRAGGPGSLVTNLRGGLFSDIGEAVGAAAGPAVAAVAEDLDNDGDHDLALLGATGLTLLANDGDGTFGPASERPHGGAAGLLSGDLDNDGWMDLVLSTPDRVQWWPNGGALQFGAAREVGAGRALAVADWNADGALDVLTGDDIATRWHQQVAPAGNWVTVSLAGIKNNLRGRGAKIEITTDDLYQLRTLRGGGAHFGLGTSESAAVVRITWPNGIVQNEIEVAGNAPLGPVTEVERLEGSCPLLYTWDGESWRFVNEVLGVAPLGMPLGADLIHPADFDEYVPVPGEALAEKDGGYELRFTEELREAGYLDAIRLIAVDRPDHMAVYPDEKFVAPPHPDFRLFTVTSPRVPVVHDQDGVEWTGALRAVDGDWTRPFDNDRYEGLATPHWLDFDLDVEPGERVRLFLTGWVYWATGSINLVVDEDPGTTFEPVSLLVPTDSGWRVAIEDIGLPNAKNSTLAVELSELVAAGHTRFRLSTTMRLHWDAAFYTVDDVHPDGLVPAGDWRGEWNVPRPGTMELIGAAGTPVPRLTVLAPVAATIDYRGFSQLVRGRDGFETFDYTTVVPTAPWDQHRGSYTRYGEVTELLQEADDRYVIVGTGDEVVVRFDADLPPVADGWRRDWLVYLNGWVKDGDPNTLAGDRVEPLPFHGMSEYPYGDGEEFPDTPAHRAWRARYNTRDARRIHVPLAPGVVTPADAPPRVLSPPSDSRRSQRSKE